MRLQFDDRLAHCRRRQREPDAPPRHGVGLRQRPRHHHRVLHPRHRCHRVRLAIVQEPAIAFVRHQPHAALTRQLADLLEFLALGQRSRRIARRVDDDQPRALRQRPLYQLRRRREALLFPRVHEHAHRAGVVDDVFVGHPVRHRDDDFIARVQQRLRQVENGVFATHRRHALVHPVVGAEIRPVPVADRLPQLLDPVHRRVAREIGIQRRHRRLLDVVRRRKVRLSHPEIDHVHPRPAQLLGFGRHLRRRGYADQGYAV